MGRKIGTKLGAIREQYGMQREIEGQFGEEAIRKATERLCSRCSVPHCFLCPLTTKGEDCPYFELKKVKK